MPIYLNSNSESLKFQEGLPNNYRGPILRGSKVLFFAKDTCQLIIQEIITELYTLRLNVFRFMETLTLDYFSKKEGIHSRALLKENLRHKIEGAGRIYLREGEFTILWSNTAHCKCTFEKDKEYKTFDIFYSPELIQQLVLFFPALKDLGIDEKTELLVRTPSFITPAMHDIIRQILECPFDESTSQFYFDLKVREYLYVMLERAYNRPGSRYHFTPYETACIIKAHTILLEDLSKKAPTLRMLSKAVALNEFKLKAGYRQIFGLSIFDSLQGARMEKARELLHTTNEPLKHICILTGYPRMTNFITAFRKRFGYTPGSLRRK